MAKLPPEEAAEQAVLVSIKLSDEGFGQSKEQQGIFALEERLEAAVDQHRVGEFDGDEFGAGVCRLFMYGPSADKLFDVILPILRSFPLPDGSYAIKRYGEPGAREARVDL